MAPTLQSASNPSPEPQRKHRGRFVIGAFVALSALLLWVGFMITQTRPEKSALDEPAESRAAAVTPPSPRPPSPPVPTEPVKAAPDEATAAPSETPAPPRDVATAARASGEQAATTKKVVATEGTAPARALTRAPPLPARSTPPQSSNKKKSKSFDDPLADQK